MLVLRKGRCGEQHLARFQHRRKTVDAHPPHRCRSTEIRIDAFSRTNRLPRGAAKRVGILRAVIHSPVHGRAYRVRYAERIDVRGQVERREAVAVDVGLDIAAVDIGWQCCHPFKYEFSLSHSVLTFYDQRIAQHSTSANTLAAVIRSTVARISVRSTRRIGSPKAAF